MKKVKVALIGIGHDHATPNIERVIKHTELYDIVGYALPENEDTKFKNSLGKLDGLKRMTIEEIMNDNSIEAVVIETEDMWLSKYALYAAEHKKHIFMDKPGGTSVEEFERLIAAVKANSLVFTTGYMYRYNPFVKDVLKRVKAGELGDIISVEAQMNCYHNPEKREWLKNFPGGMMFYLGCHLVDLILQIQGKPDSIIPLSRSTNTDGVDAVDFGMAAFTYKNGVSFAKTSAVELGGFMRRQLVVTGTKCNIEIKTFEVACEGGQYTEKTEYTSKDWVNAGVNSRSEVHDRYDEMVASFAKTIRGELSPVCTPDYELELYKTLIEACK